MHNVPPCSLIHAIGITLEAVASAKQGTYHEQAKKLFHVFL